MKKQFLKLAFAGLFALSLGTAGGIFAEVATAGPLIVHCTYKVCQVSIGCPGTPCQCEYSNQYFEYECMPPLL